MCDTIVIRDKGVTWFAKNSDREADEPQALIFRDRVANDSAATVRCTYIDIPQVATRHAVLLSQPVWLWGGEIGVNEHGVAIGNEAAFSHTAKRNTPALLGMDLLRLGLERARTAREALDVITHLLAAHGQGGPGAYRDKGFRYDNTFLIADATDAWVLETAGRLWVAKCIPENGRHAISNCYSLGSDFNLSSPGLLDEARKLGVWNGKGEFHFANTFDTWLYAFVGGSHRRREIHTQAACSVTTTTLRSVAQGLRSHGQHGDDFASHDNRQVCLHAGSLLRPSQTTASLIARLTPGGFDMAATGTSAPCLSLFQSLRFGQQDTGGLVCDPGTAVSATRWYRFEPIHQRGLFDPEFRAALHRSRDALENDLTDNHAVAAATASDWHEQWQITAEKTPPRWPGRLGRWWRRRAEREAIDGALHYGV